MKERKEELKERMREIKNMKVKLGEKSLMGQ